MGEGTFVPIDRYRGERAARVQESVFPGIDEEFVEQDHVAVPGSVRFEDGMLKNPPGWVAAVAQADFSEGESGAQAGQEIAQGFVSDFEGIAQKTSLDGFAGEGGGGWTGAKHLQSQGAVHQSAAALLKADFAAARADHGLDQLENVESRIDQAGMDELELGSSQVHRENAR
jgi:hypothetical protein